MTWYDSPIFCRLRYALGFNGHVILAVDEVESTSGGFWLHEQCRRSNCPYRKKKKVIADGPANFLPEPEEIANFDYEGILSVVEHDMKWLLARNEDLITYRNYFEAQQDTAFPTAELKYALGDAYDTFKFNLCEVVVGAVEERIDVRSISMDGQNDLTAELWSQLIRNNKSYIEEELYNGALVESRSTLFIWPDADSDGNTTGVRFDPVEATKVWLTYQNGDPRRIIRALKLWYTTTNRIMATLYTPDRIYKFEGDRNLFETLGTKEQNILTQGRELPQTHTRIWRRREIAGESWPMENPYGEVPVVEFTNRHYKSEVRDAIPVQDTLNKTLADMVVAAEYDADPQKYIVTSNEEPEGGWKNGPGQIWHIEPEVSYDGQPLPVQVGQFQVNDLKAYVNLIEQLIMLAAAITRTPGSHFMVNVNAGGRGDAPSGDALRVAETGLVKKIEKLQERWQASWQRAFRLAAMTLNNFNEPEADFTTLNVAWRHPMAHYRFMLLEEARKMKDELGLPLEIAWRYAGLTEGEIEMAKSLMPTQPPTSPPNTLNEPQPNEPTSDV